MPDGACVIKYDGAHGVVWRVKFRDATGRQVKETVGSAADGWTKRKAEAALRNRLSDVEREGYCRPEPVTFKTVALEWLDTYPDAHGLKRSTREGYHLIVNVALIPALGTFRLDEVDVQRVERYIATAAADGLAPRTIGNHLNVLRLVLASGVKRGLIRANPVTLVDRPKAPRRKWRILSPVEVRKTEQAFAELVEAAPVEERPWFEVCRLVFLVAYGIGLRRGEILGLRWHSVHLADPEGATLRVSETFVRGAADTPKSERGERTIALGARLADELFQHRARTAYAGEDERVFCSPDRGTPLNPKAYAETFRAALKGAGVEDYTRPFHDGRHSSITNAAAAGTSPAALMARAGHSDFATTQLYIDLAGERFRDEAELLERRLWGATGTKNRYQDERQTEDAAAEVAAVQD
jgi:integrase